MRSLTLALLLVTATTPLAAAPQDYAAAVGFKDRAPDDVKLDASRRPAEILDFMQVRPGMATLDLIAGGGYYSELLARAVGPKGSVTAFEPAGFIDDKAKAAHAALTGREANVTFTTDLMAALKPATYDFTMIHLNYHDFYWESAKYKVPRTDPNMVLAGLFAATKPGGIVAVVDHVGPAGDTRAIVDKLHRIAPAVVKADFERAGFMFEAESALLHNTTDDHSKVVFDPAVRGKTDRFAFRFRKPA